MNQKGNAILLAILIMGVITTLTLGVNVLILNELKQNVYFIDAGKAYYAAEAGVENALLDLDLKNPGYENQDEFEYGQDYGFNYEIDNQTDVIQQNELGDFNVLSFNDSLTIPLYKDDGFGGIEPINEFSFCFYVDETITKIDPVALNTFDILEYNIFGVDSQGKTESISDFLPGSGMEVPRCFGTFNATHTTGKYFTRDENGDLIFFYNEDITQTDDSTRTAGYPLRQFLSEHSRNTLKVTNLFNPQLLTFSGEESQLFANIFYRIESGVGEELVRPEAIIKVDGFSGEAKQSLDVTLIEGGLLPVFDFTLYRRSL